MTCSDRNLPRSSVHSLVVDEVATPANPRKNGLLSCCAHAHPREQITSPPTYTAHTYSLANGVTDSDVEIYGLRSSDPHVTATLCAACAARWWRTIEPAGDKSGRDIRTYIVWAWREKLRYKTIKTSSPCRYFIWQTNLQLFKKSVQEDFD
jgi:hypothetical protein